MTVTVWGECGGPGTLAATYNRSGQLTEARSYRELSLDLPERGVEVDCDHDGVRVGSLLFAELGDDERLRAVCAIDGDWLADVDRPVYLSPLFEMRGQGIDRTDMYIARAAELIGLSLTFQTARIGAHPVSLRRGDLRDSSARFSSWPSSWRSSGPLLDRALNHLGTDWQARSRTASRVIDLRQREADYPLELRRPLRRGALEHGPPGRVISVR
jgi:hypothetical protein